MNACGKAEGLQDGESEDTHAFNGKGLMFSGRE